MPDPADRPPASGEPRQFPPIETFACQDGLHTFCDGKGMDEQRRSVTCQCPCHRSEHVTDADDPLACWCKPYRDTEEPLLIIHRKEGEA
jgi:hypothetical protein